jgi:hypothetical protein
MAASEADGRVRIEIESDCESVECLAVVLERFGPVGVREVMSSAAKGNSILAAASETLPHSACPVGVAAIKAAEVELGLNTPCSVTIEFEAERPTHPLSEEPCVLGGRSQ